jgi:hypothetical protein
MLKRLETAASSIAGTVLWKQRYRVTGIANGVPNSDKGLTYYLEACYVILSIVGHCHFRCGFLAPGENGCRIGRLNCRK